MESTMALEVEADESQFDDVQSLLSRPSFQSLEPLDEAIAVYRQLSGFRIIPDTQLITIRRILCQLLSKRYQKKRLLADLDIAIASAKFVSSHHEGTGYSENCSDLGSLGILLYERFQRTKKQEDIDDSIQSIQKAIGAAGENGMQLVKLMNHLATCLCARFHITQKGDDLTASITTTKQALQITRSQHLSDASIILQNNLSVRLVVGYNLSENAQDLEEAQTTCLAALSSSTEDKQYRAELLVTRARIAFVCYTKSYFWKDLDEAKNSAKEALALKPTDPFTLIVIYQNLAVFHLHSFKVGKSSIDLRAALQNARLAVSQGEKMKLHIDSAQETLFQYYQAALLHTGKMTELQGLIDVLEDQIDRIPRLAPRDTKRDQYLNLLDLKFQHTGDHTDLIFLCYEALQLLNTTNQGTGQEVKSLREKLKEGLSDLLGEVYRYVLIPEFINVRDGFITTLHEEYLKYKNEGALGALGALEGILRKSNVLPFRIHRLNGDSHARQDEVFRHTYKLAQIMDKVRRKARTENDPTPMYQFRYRTGIGIRMPNRSSRPEDMISVQEARKALSLADSKQMPLPDAMPLKDDPVETAKKYHQLAGALLNQANGLMHKDKTASSSALTEALSAAKKAINTFPKHSQDHLQALVKYITICQAKDDLGNEHAVTDEDLGVVENTLGGLTPSFSKLYLQLQLCQIRRMRYVRSRNIEELNRARALADVIVPESFISSDFRDQQYWFERVTIVCQVFRTQYQQLSDLAALDRGISLLRKALRYAQARDTTNVPADDNLANSFMIMGSMLRHRYRHLGAFRDLEEAVVNGRTAVRMAKKADFPKHLGDAIMNNVSVVIEDLFGRTRKLEDLQEAIGLIESVQDGRQLTINHANMLCGRFDLLKDIRDLEKAASIARAAVQHKGDDNAYWENTCSDAAEIMLAMFHQTKEMQYIDDALEYAEIALKQMTKDSPWMTTHLLVHGDILLAKSKTQTSAQGDRLRDRGISSFLSAWHNESGNPASRIAAARRAARIYCYKQDWLSACSLLAAAVEFLSKLSPPWLDHHDRQDRIKDCSGMAADAAVLALKTGKPVYEAVRLLELGRSIIMGSSIDVRSDISHLGDVHPELQRQFNLLRMGLDTSNDEESQIYRSRDHSFNSQDYQRYGKNFQLQEMETSTFQDRRKEIFTQMNTLLAKIRNQPNFENFMQPLPQHEILKVAEDGPIVFVLCSDITETTKAIIVQKTGLSELTLSAGTPFELTHRLQRLRSDLLNGPLRTYAARNKEFCGELAWLWWNVVEPVLALVKVNSKEEFTNKKPHVRWIGVGPFSCISFHAAGVHHAFSTNNTISHIISSYPTSIRALQYIREPLKRSVQLDRLYIATMEKTTDCPPLPFVSQELSIISSIASKSIPVACNPDPTPKEVLAQLPHYNLVHFACHGISDASDPFNSRLLLKDSDKHYGHTVPTSKPLYVRDLLTSRSPRADLAYISACSSADNSAEKLEDEAVHIASVFQLAGFRNVVASLWSQKDRVCLGIAEAFYEELFRLKKERSGEADGKWAAAEALHKAVVDYRKKKPEMALQWASFIHIGG